MEVAQFPFLATADSLHSSHPPSAPSQSPCSALKLFLFLPAQILLSHREQRHPFPHPFSLCSSHSDPPSPPTPHPLPTPLCASRSSPEKQQVQRGLQRAGRLVGKHVQAFQPLLTVISPPLPPNIQSVTSSPILHPISLNPFTPCLPALHLYLCTCSTSSTTQLL